VKKVIHLLSGPRNISTALMYAFAQHTELDVLDEPFYGYYLHAVKDREAHPMEVEILSAMPKCRDTILQQINGLAKHRKVFIKNMAHHCLESDPHYMAGWQNIILIRHPKKLLASFSKVIERPSLEAIGLKKASELSKFFDNVSIPYLIIDSDQLMVDPPTYIEQMCEEIGLIYEPGMCKWPKGGNRADGIWAPYWYNNVHQSSGFNRPNIKDNIEHWNDHLESVLEEALPYYNHMRLRALINKNTNATKI